MRRFSTILVTGGAGFIGSNLIRFLLGPAGFQGKIVNFDALTYAGNLENLGDTAEKFGPGRYSFVHADIRDTAAVQDVFKRHAPDAVIHLAAETHVDRSIIGPRDFLETNVVGTFHLLEAARAAWRDRADVLFHHVSTDEVYGSLDEGVKSRETAPYNPGSPYAASKAASDHLVFAYSNTYRLPVTVSICSNNYGPSQFPEKLIPLMITNMLSGRSLPIYGDGRYVRDWLSVQDHAAAIWLIMQAGTLGEKYNVGGEREIENLRLLRDLMVIVSRKTGRPVLDFEALITFVTDRPGHDRRYAVDCSKIRDELGWVRSVSFEEGLERTVDWYLDNHGWVERARGGDRSQWIETNHGSRG